MTDLTTRPTGVPSAEAGSATDQGPLLVGIDGSDNALHAARWAASVAKTADRKIVALHASSAWLGLEMSLPTLDYDLYKQSVDRAAEDWSSEAMDGATYTTVVLEGDPAHALLLEQTESEASLVVVGAHAHGSWTPPILGSVTAKVLHASGAPVAVVPRSASIDPPSGSLVVGVDGSAPSLRALLWAASWARDLGVGVYALCAYSMDGYSEKPRLAGLDSDDPMSDTLAALRRLADQVSDEFGIEVSSDMVIGDAAEQLIASGPDRFAVVVGRTGHRSFAEAVFGSTSRTCATHSTVPVVVVP